MNLTASDRKALIRLASTLPVGSDERKVILAGLKKSKQAAPTPAVDETLAPYQNLAADFERKFRALDMSSGRVRYFGKTVSAGPFKAFGPMDAQKLATWLKKANVSEFQTTAKGIYLQW